jgi:methylated-DNA-[protein]-cysteine S-methyltransferase
MTKSPVFHFSVFPTSAGTFSVAVDKSGAVAAAAFGGRKALRSRLGRGTLVEDPRRTGEARRQVTAWLRGKRREFSVGLSPSGTPFQRQVWAALREIPYGETRTYGDVARTVRSSPRAVGRANATNPVCLIVPCHRVIGSDGSLTGYAFGERTKRSLLRLEGA